MRIASIVLIIGILLGGSLIALGIIKTNEVKKQNEQVSQQIEQNNQSRTATDIQADIDEIQAQIDQIDLDIKRLQNEKSKIFQEDKGFSDRYYAKDEEITVKQSQRSKLQSTL